jgi:beta-phosphoglucomutase family hydrolase
LTGGTVSSFVRSHRGDINMADSHTALLSFDAVLFDLDGVLTATAKIHAACWKSMFDDFLRRRADRDRKPFTPFDIERDYETYVDGKPRYDGVRSFLESRSIKLPYGSPDDDSTIESVCGLGNHKDALLRQAIAAGKVEAYPGSVALVRELHERKMPMAVVSSSNNCKEVLDAVGLTDLFATRVDGNVITEKNLNGKPAPDTYLYAARTLHVTPGRAVVVEDALAGVEAGRAGGFGLVIGVDRVHVGAALREHGANIVVTDLAELIPK